MRCRPGAFPHSAFRTVPALRCSVPLRSTLQCGVNRCGNALAKTHVVAAVSEVPPGGRNLAEASGRAIVVLHPGGEFFALPNRWPHLGVSLCEGNLTGLLLSEEPGHYNSIR